MKFLLSRPKYGSSQPCLHTIIHQVRRTNLLAMLISICIILSFLIFIDVISKKLRYAGESKTLEQMFMTIKPDTYTRLVRDNIQYYINERWIPSVHAKFTVLPLEKLALCQSETRATPILLNFFCFSQYIRLHPNESKMFGGFENGCVGNLNLFATTEVFLNMPTGVNILFLIEEPFRRFAQAFRKLCLERIVQHPQICFGCGSDIACVVSKLPAALKKWNDGVVNNSLENMEKMYFSPQSWNCGLMNTYEMTTFVRLDDKQEVDSIPEKARNMLIKSGINSSYIDKFNEMVKGNPPRTSTVEKNISYILYSAKDLKNKLKRIYHDDFELFHLTV